MADPQYAVQDALYSALGTALGALSPAIQVFDQAPQDQSHPFVLIGDAIGLNDDCKNQNGVEHNVEIQIYSTHRGRKEVKQLMSTIYDTLHNQRLTVTGFASSYWSFQFGDSFVETEGSRGVMRFRVRTQPE